MITAIAILCSFLLGRWSASHNARQVVLRRMSRVEGTELWYELRDVFFRLGGSQTFKNR